MTGPALPESRELACRREGGRLWVTLDRPDARNALTPTMAEDLAAVFNAVAGDRSVRVVVLRGAGGNLCAGADLRAMASLRAAGTEADDPLVRVNRTFGDLLQRVDRAPQVVVAVAEGAVMGGGLGLACAADVTLAHQGATFALPETTLGLVPAQVAPFLVRRVGLATARMLAVTGAKVNAARARGIGLVHAVAGADLDARLDDLLRRIERCAPTAVAETKALLLRAHEAPVAKALDEGARVFARLARGPEAAEGLSAFLAGRRPSWAPPAATGSPGPTTDPRKAP